MKAKYLLTFFASFLFITMSVAKDKLHILYNAECMDKLEYKQGGETYITYQVQANDGTKIVLNIGTESKKSVDELPLPFIGCYNGDFDKDLVKRINSSFVDILMVYQKGKKYYVSPIQSAAIYTKEKNNITYASPEYSFKFDLKAGTIGENISTDRYAKVYFEGRLDNSCSGTYIFRKTTDGDKFVDIKLVPEIGLLEQQHGANGYLDKASKMVLNKINRTSASRYLKKLCAGITEEEIISFDPKPINANPEVTPIAASKSTKKLTAKGGEQSDTPKSYSDTSAPKEIHTVKKGDTLYGIARKYGISVKDIRKWNNKAGSTIRAGEKIRVKAPSGVAETTAKGGQFEWDKKEELTAKSGTATSTKPVAFNPNAKYHIVRVGETPSSIAMKYGYTEAKLRNMNNIPNDKYIKVGQRLKVSECNCPDVSKAKSPVGNITSSNGRVVIEEPAQPRTLEPAPYDQPSTIGAPASYEVPSDLQPKGVSSYNTTPQSYSSPTHYSVPNNQPATNNTNGLQHYDTPITTTAPAYRAKAAMPQPKKITYPKYGVPEADFDQAEDLTPKGYEAPSSDLTAKGVTHTYEAQTEQRGDRTIYVVQEGDNLYRIARRYGVKVAHLRAINNLEVNETIMPFQKIYIH